jgi:predicted transcriptional regulator of viral defense system
MSASRKVPTGEFFATHPIFSLDEAMVAFAPPRGKRGAAERLRYHVEAGRLKRIAREIYAVVPHGVKSARFQPDPFLVAATIRRDGVFSHHSALELLGAAHSTWNHVTIYGKRRRPPLTLNGITLRFLSRPGPLSSDEEFRFATRKVERRGRMLLTTGPERTLVEGFHRLDRIGGPEELVVSASGFAILDLELLEEVLSRYAVRRLWAATGWFLESFQESFHVPDTYLRRLERFRPGSPRYLRRSDRGGVLVPRWNLILPDQLTRMTDPDDR